MPSSLLATELERHIRTISDYPKPGIAFRDITTLLKEGSVFKRCIDTFQDRYQAWRIDKVVGIESRGFIVGAPLAYALGAGFVPLRKSGKLPAATVGKDYQLEYGTDRIEVHTDAIQPGERTLLIDDLIATGGTALAGIEVLQALGADILECAFIIDLPDLGGSDKLKASDHNVFSLCEYDGK